MLKDAKAVTAFADFLLSGLGSEIRSEDQRLEVSGTAADPNRVHQ